MDDDEDIRDSLVALLRDEGYETQSARSGLVALSMMTWGQFVPDVILLDLLMPSMSGDQFREVLQKHPQWRSIPIVVCSGAMPETAGTKVFGVLEKPFDLERMLTLVKSACASRPS